MQRMKSDIAINSLYLSAVYNGDFLLKGTILTTGSSHILELKLKVKEYPGNCGPEAILISQRKRIFLLKMCGVVTFGSPMPTLYGLTISHSQGA